jgi:Leucine-rich repeat (LRR) protein
MCCSLEVLDLRRNKIRKVPLELEEVKGLKVLLLAHNKIEHYPGNIYRLGIKFTALTPLLLHDMTCCIIAAGMQNLDLSHNRFPSIPVEVGNMELLKDLHEWEVGIGLFQKLSELNVSYCKLTEWPGQVKKIPSLQLLNLAGNGLESVSVDLAANSSLKYLDLSCNKFIVLPVQFYSLTQLQVDIDTSLSLCQ